MHKMEGRIPSSYSVHLERLMNVLEFFDNWQRELREVPADGSDWKRYFTTRESFFDLRIGILGFISVCRYLFAQPEKYKVNRHSSINTRFINPRSCSQVCVVLCLTPCHGPNRIFSACMRR